MGGLETEFNPERDCKDVLGDGRCKFFRMTDEQKEVEAADLGVSVEDLDCTQGDIPGCVAEFEGQASDLYGRLATGEESGDVFRYLDDEEAAIWGLLTRGFNRRGSDSGGSNG